MPEIVHLHVSMFHAETRLSAVSETAALHELVLTSALPMMVHGRLALLRRALSPRRLVALLVADDLPPIERVYVDELLNDGVIPLLLFFGDGPGAALMSWLESDERSGAGARRGRGPRGASRGHDAGPMCRAG